MNKKQNNNNEIPKFNPSGSFQLKNKPTHFNDTYQFWNFCSEMMPRLTT